MYADQGQASRLQAGPSVQPVEGRTQVLRCLGEPSLLPKGTVFNRVTAG